MYMVEGVLVGECGKGGFMEQEDEKNVQSVVGWQQEILYIKKTRDFLIH